MEAKDKKAKKAKINKDAKKAKIAEINKDAKKAKIAKINKDAKKAKIAEINKDANKAKIAEIENRIAAIEKRNDEIDMKKAAKKAEAENENADKLAAMLAKK